MNNIKTFLVIYILIKLHLYTFFFHSETCTKHQVFEHLIVECNGPYTGSNEMKANHSAKWGPAFNKTVRFRNRRGKRPALYKGLEDPWMNQGEFRFFFRSISEHYTFLRGNIFLMVPKWVFG